MQKLHRLSQSGRFGKRQPYKKEYLSRNKEDTLMVESPEDSSPHGYVEIEDGSLLPEALVELYNFCKRDKVPDDWTQPFQNFKSFGNKAKADCGYLD